MGRSAGRKKNGGKWIIRIELIVLLAFVCAAVSRELRSRSTEPGQPGGKTAAGQTSESGEAIEVSAAGNYIKWVEFHATCEALAAAYDLAERIQQS